MHDTDKFQLKFTMPQGAGDADAVEVGYLTMVTKYLLGGVFDVFSHSPSVNSIGGYPLADEQESKPGKDTDAKNTAAKDDTDALVQGVINSAAPVIVFKTSFSSEVKVEDTAEDIVDPGPFKVERGPSLRHQNSKAIELEFVPPRSLVNDEASASASAQDSVALLLEHGSSLAASAPIDESSASDKNDSSLVASASASASTSANDSSKADPMGESQGKFRAAAKQAFDPPVPVDTFRISSPATATKVKINSLGDDVNGNGSKNPIGLSQAEVDIMVSALLVAIHFVVYPALRSVRFLDCFCMFALKGV